MKKKILSAFYERRRFLPKHEEAFADVNSGWTLASKMNSIVMEIVSAIALSSGPSTVARIQTTPTSFLHVLLWKHVHRASMSQTPCLRKNIIR